ncbi:MAG: TIGR04211 family SH3 domain-containing protein [Desulfobacterales bacterium]|jgi:SH3 domain protein|nr:TIGR04211 family SH3 domain-containing protein [Desulfobacterales bacterium]
MVWKPAWGVVIGVCLLGLAGGAWSQPVYVSDVIRVSVRSGPGGEHKSLAVTESGQQLELLKPGEEWSLVRLANGTEGYVLSRFLTEAPPGRHQLLRLEEKIKALAAQATALTEENSRVKTEKEALAAAAADGQLALDRLRAEFERFRNETADAAALKAKADALSAELEQKTRQIAELSARAEDAFPVSTLYWFLAGAGVLLVGFLTGFSVKRQRRWSTLS